MLVANIVVETLPGKAHTVAERMGSVRGMEGLAADGDCRVTATWKVPNDDALESLCEVLHALNPEIIEVSPTLVGEAD